MENYTQKLTKRHIKQGNHSTLKIYQVIFIDLIGCVIN